MSEISTSLIEKAIYNLCFKANTCLNNDVYSKIYNAYLNSKTDEEKNAKNNILNIGYPNDILHNILWNYFSTKP